MLIKDIDQEVTELMVASLVGQYIHVPTNKHKNVETGEEINAWFAGKVAGYERTVLHFDYLNGVYREEPVGHFTLLLTDGMGYVLSEEGSEIHELTDDEFNLMVAEHMANQAADELVEEAISNIITPEKKILLPGEDF